MSGTGRGPRPDTRDEGEATDGAVFWVPKPLVQAARRDLRIRYLHKING